MHKGRKPNRTALPKLHRQENTCLRSFFDADEIWPNITGNLFSRFCRIASGVSADRISRYYTKYDICPKEPIKNDKKYRLKPGRVVVWLKCPRGACIFFSQSLHLKHRTISYFI